MTPLSVFGCGVLGSAAVELVTVLQYYEASDHGIKLPDRYFLRGFWFARSLLALMAGSLAVFYGIDNPILAINVGASAPLIIRLFAQGVRAQLTPPSNQSRS